ncbi:Uncharacterised protein [Enterobacter roggenkampii]|uniref:Uncharacterized protein n=1 Tax=Enterobacter roggenkampii TaxID=1812935 RepID=A0ABY0IZK5_9ENTR|nr:Uncharacterised protein [Enterobacter roggenkampii]
MSLMLLLFESGYLILKYVKKRSFSRIAMLSDHNMSLLFLDGANEQFPFDGLPIRMLMMVLGR